MLQSLVLGSASTQFHDRSAPGTTGDDTLFCKKDLGNSDQSHINCFECVERSDNTSVVLYHGWYGREGMDNQHNIPVVPGLHLIAEKWLIGDGR